MTITDFVWIAVGETLLCASFALGMLVGISLTRKDSRNDNGNSRTEAAAQWHRPRHRDTQGGDERREFRSF